MDWADRINATIRSPQYRKAYRELIAIYKQPVKSIDWEKKTTHLCNQYRLSYPVDPDRPYAVKEYIMRYGGAVQVRYSGLVLFKRKGESLLNVTLDLTMSLDQIIKEIKELYKLLVADVDKEKNKRAKRKRNRQSNTLSPWTVYDMNVLEGKNRNQIAKEIAGKEKNPAYSEEVMTVYHRVSYSLERLNVASKRWKNKQRTMQHSNPSYQRSFQASMI